MHCRRKWQPTPVFLPGESQGRGSLVGCPLWGRIHLLIQLAFHIPVDKIQPRERDRDACSIYIVVESFTAFKPHRLELNLKICPLTSFEESLIFQKMLCSLCTNGLARESGYALVTKSVIFLCI